MSLLCATGVSNTRVSECASFHADKFKKDSESFSSRCQGFIRAGQLFTGVQYVQAQRVRRKISENLLPICAQYDALVLPTTSLATSTIEETLAGAGEDPSNTMPFNALGLPAISVPRGFDSNGIPIGLQLVGKPFGEVELFALAYAFVQATEFHHQHPEI